MCVYARFGSFVAISRVEYNAVCRDWIVSTGILYCVGKAKVLDTVCGVSIGRRGKRKRERERRT